MKQKDFNEGLNHIDSDLVEEFIAKSEQIEKRNKSRGILIRAGALAACLCLIVGAVLIPMLNKKDPLPDPTPDRIVPGGISFDRLQVPSSAPQYYGSDFSIGNGGMMGSVRGDGISVTARFKEALPDTYTFYNDWRQTEFRLLKMETVKLLAGKEMTEEFLYIVPVDYMTDFSIYDKFVLIHMMQFGYEYSVLYNTTQGCLEQQNMVLFGYQSYNYSYLDTGFQAFDVNGNLDLRLWKSTEKWIDTTQGDWEYYANGYTLSQAEEEFRWEGSDLSVHLLKYLTEDSRGVLSKIISFENGIYIPSSSLNLLYYSSMAYFYVARYINGFATNEWICIENQAWRGEDRDSIFFTKAQFTKEDLSALPDLPSARAALINSFENGEITPPHIQNYSEMNQLYHGIFCWYAKTENGVIGVLRVNWMYASDDRSRECYDDAYYIVEYGSNVCTPIDRDALLERIGEYETIYIYTHPYDENGKTVSLLHWH